VHKADSVYFRAKPLILLRLFAHSGTNANMCDYRRTRKVSQVPPGSGVYEPFARARSELISSGAPTRDQ